MLVSQADGSVAAWQAGKGSATLSMAYAAAVFAESCLKAMAGQSGACLFLMQGLVANRVSTFHMWATHDQLATSQAAFNRRP